MSTARPADPRPAAARAGDSVSNVYEVERRLRGVYGLPRHDNKEDPSDELVFVVLSAQTEEYLYKRTYDRLSAAFPGWVGLAEAPEEQIAELIRAGGLHRKKARQLKGAFTKIVADVGRPRLDVLHDLDDDSILAYLTALPGVSNKTALCVMLYSLGREVFPVDTHVWRIARRLGWAEHEAPKSTTSSARALQSRVPVSLRYSIHVTLVAHGRACCVPYWPRCDDCALASVCPSRDAVDRTLLDWRKPGGIWAAAASPRQRP
jgi:endonuclease III